MTDTTMPAAQDVALAPTTLRTSSARTRFFVAFLLSVFVGLIVGVGALYAFDRTLHGADPARRHRRWHRSRRSHARRSDRAARVVVRLVRAKVARS